MVLLYSSGCPQSWGLQICVLGLATCTTKTTTWLLEIKHLLFSVSHCLGVFAVWVEHNAWNGNGLLGCCVCMYLWYVCLWCVQSLVCGGQNLTSVSSLIALHHIFLKWSPLEPRVFWLKGLRQMQCLSPPQCWGYRHMPLCHTRPGFYNGSDACTTLPLNHILSPRSEALKIPRYIYQGVLRVS